MLGSGCPEASGAAGGQSVSLTVPGRERTSTTERQPVKLAGSWPQLFANNGTQVGLRKNLDPIFMPPDQPSQPGREEQRLGHG